MRNTSDLYETHYSLRYSKIIKTYSGKSLLLIEYNPRYPNTYARDLLKELFTEDELCTGLIDPKHTKDAERALDEERIAFIKCILL